MPIYEYTCGSCSSRVELLVRGGDGPAECPECGSRRLQKEFSVPAAHSAGGLPVCSPAPPPGGCGLAQCGGGRCAP